MTVETGTEGTGEQRQAIQFIDTGEERGGNRAHFEQLIARLKNEPPSEQPKAVLVTELSRLIRSSSEKAAVDALLDSRRAEVLSGREHIFTAEDGGRERYEQASRLLALAYDGAFAPEAGTRAELVSAYVTDVLGPWLAIHGTPEDEARVAVADVRARLSSLANMWGTPAAHALLGAYRELTDGHEPAELPACARELALVGVRNSELETLHLDDHILQSDWRLLTQAAAYTFRPFDEVPSGDLDDAADPFAGVAEASPAAAAAFAALYELPLGEETTWDASLIGTGKLFDLEVVTVPISPEGYDVMHAMDPRVPRRFMTGLLDADPEHVLVVPSFKHISRSPEKLFPLIEETLRRGRPTATNNCYLTPGRVRRRDVWVQYNDLDVEWCLEEKVSARDLLGKPGRNDPCPCGSGKKYKRCCGA